MIPGQDGREGRLRYHFCRGAPRPPPLERDQRHLRGKIAASACVSIAFAASKQAQGRARLAPRWRSALSP